MKRLSVILLVLLLTLSFAACSVGSALKDAAKKSVDTKGSETVTEGAAESADEVPDTAAQAVNLNPGKWPKEILHPDMPEYKKGKLNGWAPWDASNPDSIFILIRDTGEADLEEYRKEMEAAGFTPGNNHGYHKDLFDVEFQMNSDNTLQISSYKNVTEGWPKALSAISPINGGDLTVIDGANEETPDSMNLYYINLPAEELGTWRQELGKKGFNVENDTITAENIQFNGDTYSQAEIWYEENGDKEWNIYFEFKK